MSGATANQGGKGGKGSAPAISPTRAENFPEWYQQIVRAADMAESSEVRGCMVIKPWGMGVWERIRGRLDRRFQETGHENAYFPLLIPLSYLQKEAEHVEGFAAECAVVTHHRLAKDADGQLQPEGELAEPYVIRPTSETIIGAAFARWIQSWRDLPVLINQWANVMRWEMRPRLFLRTAEFLWQEGHTAHETEAEAVEETERMHVVYERFMRDFLALPVIIGEKTEGERFPGAVRTLTCECMVQDRKAIQAGTSHFLGQNFSKAAGIEFAARDGSLQHAWTTSWGVSTRLIGAMLMAHGDDDGAILPPAAAPAQVAILPISPRDDQRDAVIEACEALATTIAHHDWDGEPMRARVDARPIPGGRKNWEWIKKGAPLRVEIGPRDIERRQVCLRRRDEPAREKRFMDKEEFLRELPDILQEIQDGLLARAQEFSDANTRRIETMDELREMFAEGGAGGFALAPWAGGIEDEARLQSEMKLTVRCLPHGENYAWGGPCIATGREATRLALIGRGY